jgi:hypothetical protein
LIAQGLTNVEVARRLEVTIHAVKFHLASIYRKLGVANRTEAAGVFFQERAALPDEVVLASEVSGVPISPIASRARDALLSAFAVARRLYAANKPR